GVKDPISGHGNECTSTDTTRSRSGEKPCGSTEWDVSDEG
ncbi:MAG: hypothetical protein EZS28_013028, partial [Streblomastix strix]